MDFDSEKDEQFRKHVLSIIEEKSIADPEVLFKYLKALFVNCQNKSSEECKKYLNGNLKDFFLDETDQVVNSLISKRYSFQQAKSLQQHKGTKNSNESSEIPSNDNKYTNNDVISSIGGTKNEKDMLGDDDDDGAFYKEDSVKKNRKRNTKRSRSPSDSHRSRSESPIDSPHYKRRRRPSYDTSPIKEGGERERSLSPSLKYKNASSSRDKYDDNRSSHYQSQHHHRSSDRKGQSKESNRHAHRHQYNNRRDNYEQRERDSEIQNIDNQELSSGRNQSDDYNINKKYGYPSRGGKRGGRGGLQDTSAGRHSSVRGHLTRGRGGGRGSNRYNSNLRNQSYYHSSSNDENNNHTSGTSANDESMERIEVEAYNPEHPEYDTHAVQRNSFAKEGSNTMYNRDDESITLVSRGKVKQKYQQNSDGEVISSDNPNSPTDENDMSESASKKYTEKLHSEYDKSKPTLGLASVPPELNTLENILNHFSKYGTIANIMVKNKLGKAYVQFETKEDASKALKSPEAVLGNRFIKMFWVKSALPIKDQGEKKSIAASSDVKSSSSSVTLQEHIDKQQQDKLKAFMEISRKKELLISQQIKLQKELLKKLEDMKGDSPAKREIMLKIKSLHEQIQEAVKSQEKSMAIAKQSSKQKDLSPSSATSTTASSSSTTTTITSSSSKETFERETKQKAENTGEAMKHTLETNPGLSQSEDIPPSSTNVHPKNQNLKEDNTKSDNNEAGKSASNQEIKNENISMPQSLQSSRSSFPSSRGVTRGRGRGTRGGWRGRGRGRGTSKFNMVVDNRTTTIIVQNVPREKLNEADLKSHFQNFGDVQAVSIQGDCAAVKFGSRKSAEMAITKGNTLEGTKLNFGWRNQGQMENSSVTNSDSQVHPAEITNLYEEDDTLEGVHEEETILDDDEEEDRETSWKR